MFNATETNVNGCGEREAWGAGRWNNSMLETERPCSCTGPARASPPLLPHTHPLPCCCPPTPTLIAAVKDTPSGSSVGPPSHMAASRCRAWRGGRQGTAGEGRWRSRESVDGQQ